MPNWCHNHLEITGEAEHLAQLNWEQQGFFDHKVEPQQLLFAQYLPQPKDIGKYWYDWRLENWGCKWDCVIEEAALESDYIRLQFDSPWSPPIEGLTTLSQKFSQLTFRLEYSEPGCDFQGLLILESGVETTHLQNAFFGAEQICSSCTQTYQPEIDLDGHITNDICRTCGTEH